MEQIAVSFTDGGVPKTGLSPKVTIIGRDGTVYVQDGALKELGYGWYIYNFAKYSPTKVYLYLFDGGSELSSDYDRYKFGGNEFDAYSNKYSWGRTAAPYFTSINGRFDNIDKLFKEAAKNRYNDSEVKKAINEVKREIRGANLVEKLSELQTLINTVNSSIKSESSSKGVSDLNGKLDLMAEYVVKMKQDMDMELNSLDENVAQRISESNTNLNEGMSNKVSIEQLLQQVERLENRMNTVLDAFVKTQMEGLLPKDISDQYDVNISRKNGMSDEEVMAALGINMGTSEGLNEGMNQGMEEGMSEGLGEERPASVNAPVDMQGIAEPVMPNGI